MKRKEATEPIYGTRVLFLLGGTLKDACKVATRWLKREEPLQYDGNRGMAFRGKESNYVLWVEKPTDYATLAHEAGHIAIWVMGHVEIPITENSDEPFTYYLGWLMREALK